LRIEYGRPNSTEPVRITGERLVRPDGTVGLGSLGSVLVVGRTVQEARRTIARHLESHLDGFDPRKLLVEVVAFNSKYFYVITANDHGGEQVERFPTTGNATVLDAIAAAKVGLVAERQKRFCLVRRSNDGKENEVLWVDWEALTRRGEAKTNYLLQPGDRLFLRVCKPSVQKLYRILTQEERDAMTKELSEEVKKPECARPAPAEAASPR
jgi:protein involved in polysaccharide export with SLBB domain